MQWYVICYQWFKQGLTQRSQFKEDTVEPSVPAREFNLKAYAAITRQMIRPGWASNPHSSVTVARQRVRDAANSATGAGMITENVCAVLC